MLKGGWFDISDQSAYGAWRRRKLDDYPERGEDLIVELADPNTPSPAELAEIRRICAKTNMVIYAGPPAPPLSKEGVRRLGGRVGLDRLDANPLSDDDGISPIAVAPEGTRNRYIPYTQRPISWHTDGYYNPPSRTIRGMVLHCVQDAAEGGANGLMDPDMLYIWLRDRDPDLIRALMEPDVMTIPANEEEGFPRPAQTGPVFSMDHETGALHMRYTARSRSIEWKDDAATRRASAAVTEALAGAAPYVFHHRLMPGQGILCNNVLHSRAGFEDHKATDAPQPGRLLWRARYLDRIANT